MNPFAPPTDDSPLIVRQSSDYRMHGDTLVVQKDATLPNFCIYSGEPSTARIKRKLTWVPPALAALVVISPLIYLIVYLIVRKTGSLDYSLGEAARKRRTSGIAIAVGGVVAAGALFGLGVNRDSSGAVIAALLVFLVAIIVGAVRARVLHLVKIDKTHIHLKLSPPAARAFASVEAA